MPEKQSSSSTFPGSVRRPQTTLMFEGKFVNRRVAVQDRPQPGTGGDKAWPPGLPHAGSAPQADTLGDVLYARPAQKPPFTDAMCLLLAQRSHAERSRIVVECFIVLKGDERYTKTCRSDPCKSNVMYPLQKFSDLSTFNSV